MQIIFDNLAATIIAMAIFLMLASVQLRGQEVQIQATAFNALRSQQLAFMETLRLDMAGMVCGKEGDPDWKCPDIKANSSDHTFTFYTRLGNSSTISKVIYKRRKVGERNGVDLYQIQRYVDRPVSSNPDDYDGGSMPTVVSWSIQMRGGEGEEITAPADARQVHIRFETIFPYGIGEDIRSYPWKAVYRPIYLRKDKTV